MDNMADAPSMASSASYPPVSNRALPVPTRTAPPLRRETADLPPPLPVAPVTAKGTDWMGLLARFQVLSMYYQQAHWSEHGHNYYGDHLLLDRLYNEIHDEIDGIAEKGIGVTGKLDHVVLSPHLAAVSALAETLPQAPQKDHVFFQGALDFETALAAWLLAEYQSEPNIGVQNLLQGFVDAGSNRIYLLARRLLAPEMTP